ncbi:MAG: hypothetical protein N3A60_01360, partial [Thermanaerothrix sp.]|nr:hypothetical protein [Thermanaerothrix sp.]
MSQRWFSFPSVACLMAVLITAASHLGSTGWTEHLEKIPQTALAGGILGLAIGYSRFSRRLATFFAIGYTAFFIPWQLGLLITDTTSWSERLVI